MPDICEICGLDKGRPGVISHPIRVCAGRLRHMLSEVTRYAIQLERQVYPDDGNESTTIAEARRTLGWEKK